LTLQEKLASARARLIASGVPPLDTSIDVEVMARAILGWDRAQLLTHQGDPTPDTLEPRFSAFLERRERGEPVAYILGVREFWGRDFEVGPAVLIPRPETEFIVEEALLLSRRMTSPRLADIGTGSGCLAVTLACEMPDCRVVATDLSPEALAVAGRNVRRYNLDRRVELVNTSGLDRVEGDFDLIVANPPYVKRGDKPHLSHWVRREPEIALFGGTDGLSGIEVVLAATVDKLKPGGWLVMEFGYGQEDDVERLVRATPALRLDRVKEDLQGIPRTAVIECSIR
jgi:release factor glutamine methyltransferase